MLTEYDEDKALTSRRMEGGNIEPLLLKIKYLEKDNKDYEMDLDDLDASL